LEEVLIQKVVINLSSKEGGRRLDTLREKMDADSNKEVLAAAWQLYEHVQANLGGLYTKDSRGDMHLFDLPQAPKKPLLFRRKIVLMMPEHLIERLDMTAVIDRGDVRTVTERALMVLEMAVDGLELFLFSGERFDPHEMLRVEEVTSS
jgi:hypothetical protein